MLQILFRNESAAWTSQTNTDLTGFTVKANGQNPEAAKAYAALYGASGELLNIYSINVNTTGDTVATGFAKPFATAEKLSIFVWSDGGLKPMALVRVRAIRKENPKDI